MVVEGVDARATTEGEEEETRWGDASLADESGERRAGAAAAAARGTKAAALLLDAPRQHAAEEAREEEDASVDCILEREGDRNGKKNKG